MRRNLNFSAIVGACIVTITMPVAGSAQDALWQTGAKWHRALRRSEPGTLVLDATGVEFRSAKFTYRWKYIDIHTFDLSGRELTLLTYQNRHWHEPGERPFRFTLSEPMPPRIAAELAEYVGKPVRNDAPGVNAAGIAEIPAHHRVWSGGSNGVLRLKDDGIDYVSENGRDSRSWRWADIQTIANSNPYELRVTAFREIAEFELKRPLSRDQFERMWDRLYANGLNLSAGHGEGHQEIHQ